MHKLKIIALSVLASLIVVGLILVLQPNKGSVSITQVPISENAEDPVPDFSQFKVVENKKRAFFNYLLPEIIKQNQHIMQTRQRIQGWRAKVVSGETLTKSQQEQFEWLLNEYRIQQDDLLVQYDALLHKIDFLPEELVLAQAANESAWGTSRFARLGYNFFGIWCFKEGCGFVPKRRNEGAIHEVAKYKNLSQAMYAYMRNLNRHAAYDELRAIRSTLRQNQQEITGSALAEGLLQYSERREAYVEELQAMMAKNKELMSL